MENTLNITVEEGIKVLDLRTGQAERIIEKTSVDISGIIDSPLEYLKVRKTISFETANLQVDRESLKITLTLDENTDRKSIITGNLILTQEYKGFGINTGKGWVPRELAEFIKMNRICFENKEIANKLTSTLMDVKIRIDKTVENAGGQRGNIRQLKEQTLKDCNIPESLPLEMPIFKGAAKSVFNVEIWIDPESLNVKLISPDASDIIRNVRDQEINNVLTEIRSICPELAIIES